MNIVLQQGYGGFSISRPMGERLISVHGWTVGSWDSTSQDLVQSDDCFYTTKKHNINSIEFRSNPDLVETVKFLKAKLKEDYEQERISYSDHYYHYIKKLKITEYEPPKLYIEQYNDGYERLSYNDY